MTPEPSREPERRGVSLPEAWRLLRRQVERLYHVLAVPIEAGPATGPARRRPEWRAQLQDIERILRKADETVRTVEARQSQLDEEWDRALGEKWRLYGVWARLREQLTRGAAEPGARPDAQAFAQAHSVPPESALDPAQARDVAEQAAMLELLLSEIGRQESATLRERRALTSAWRRLLRDVAPAAKAGPGSAIFERLRRMDALLRVPPEVRELSAEARQAHDALLASRKEIARLERLRRGLEARLAARESDNDQLQARLTEERARLAEEAARASGADESLAKTASELSQARARAAELEAELKEAFHSLEAARGENRSLAGAFEQARAERDGLRGGGRALREEIDRLTAALARAAGDRDALQEALGAAEDRFRRNLRSAEDAAEAARQELARLTRDLGRTRGERDALCEGLSSAAEEHRRELQAVQESLNAVRRELSESQAALARMTGDRDAVRRDLESTNGALQAARSELHGLNQALARLETAGEEAAKLGAALAMARQERDSLGRELGAFGTGHRRWLSSMAESLEAARGEASRLSAALAMTQRDRDALRESAAAAEQALNAELAKARRESGALCQEFERFKEGQRRWLSSTSESMAAARLDETKLSAALAMTRRERDALRAGLETAREDFDRKLSLMEESLEPTRLELVRLNEALSAAQREREAFLRDRGAAEKSLQEKLRLAEENLKSAGAEIALLSKLLVASGKEKGASLARERAEEDALRSTLSAAGSEYRERVRLMEKSLEAARLQIARLTEEISRRDVKAEASAPQKESLGAPLEAAAGAVPMLEPVLESGWARVLELLRRPLAAAHAQLRSLAAASAAQGQRATVRLAAGFVAQAQDLVRVLLEYLEEPAGPPTGGRLQAAADSALAAWETPFKRNNVGVVRKFDADLGPIPLQPASLRVALYQVIRNAYEAMPSGGCLTVRCWKESASGQACVSFADSGPGFPKESFERLFEPMAAAKPGHPGIGLALARRVARRLGGDATAANGPEGGAVVTLRFPLGAAPPPIPEA